MNLERLQSILQEAESEQPSGEVDLVEKPQPRSKKRENKAATARELKRYEGLLAELEAFFEQHSKTSPRESKGVEKESDLRLGLCRIRLGDIINKQSETGFVVADLRRGYYHSSIGDSGNYYAITYRAIYGNRPPRDEYVDKEIYSPRRLMGEHDFGKTPLSVHISNLKETVQLLNEGVQTYGFYQSQPITSNPEIPE